MATMIVNLPVTDLERSRAFYEALGFTIDPLYSDRYAACVVVDQGRSAFMIIEREYYQTFTARSVGDPRAAVLAMPTVFVRSRAEVDRIVAAARAAGGTEDRPAADFGFMYQRQVSDPDGNVIALGWMNPIAERYGPAALASRAR